MKKGNFLSNKYLVSLSTKYVKNQLYSKQFVHNCLSDEETNEKIEEKRKKQKSEFNKILMIFSIIKSYNIPFSKSDIFNFNLIDNIIPLNWSHISLYEQYKCHLVLKCFRRINVRNRIDGYNNIWISKPSYNSRGRGIYCFQSLKNSGYSNQASKVVQKYIENPFLIFILNSLTNKLEKRKFDIRQWVLVTSFNPLIAYMFSSCYLRICSKEFSLSDISNIFTHVTNYSIQKESELAPNDIKQLIMSNEDFVELLKNYHGIKISWKNQMIPKFKKVIIKTLQSSRELGYNTNKNKVLNN